MKFFDKLFELFIILSSLSKTHTKLDRVLHKQKDRRKKFPSNLPFRKNLITLYWQSLYSSLLSIAQCTHDNVSFLGIHNWYDSYIHSYACWKLKLCNITQLAFLFSGKATATHKINCLCMFVYSGWTINLELLEI